MIDLEDLRKRPQAYQEAAKKKRIDISVEGFLNLDALRRDLIASVDDLRARRNSVSKRIPTMKKEEREAAVEEMRKLGEQLQGREEELARAEHAWKELLLQIPSIPLDRVPVGKDDTENVEIRRWGKVPTFSFTPRDHTELGEALDIIDIPRGVKVAKSRF